MPDESLGTTAGVATQAAEVSHSIAVANRTGLAYMKPTTYMTQKMVQVAMMNIRKLDRLSSANPKSENDHVPLAPFFHSLLARECQRWSVCACQASISHTGRRESQTSIAESLVASADSGEEENSVSTGSPAVEDNGGAGEDAGMGDEPVHGSDAVIVECARDGDDGAAPSRPSVEDEAAGVLRRGEVVHILPMSTRPLLDQHAAAVDAFVRNRPPSTMVRTVNKAKVELTVADFRVLTGENWLNDSGMNSFVALIHHRATLLRCLMTFKPVVVPRVFMFKTFFFSRMEERAGCYDYAGVRTWGDKNGLDIGAVDQVLIPVKVDNLH